MATTYPIKRLISGTSDCGQITVQFGNRTVTRHIKNGQGRHPDDTLPELHHTLATIVRELQLDVKKVNDTLAAIDQEIASQGPEQDAARVARPMYLIIRAVATEALLEALARHATEVTENPLFVDYVKEESTDDH